MKFIALLVCMFKIWRCCYKDYDNFYFFDESYKGIFLNNYYYYFFIMLIN
jgi:hypothetical protein